MDELHSYPGRWLDEIDAAVAVHPAPALLRPTIEELRALLDVAFFAGLHEEEGRRVTFDLALVAREAAARAAWDHLAFDRPLPLDARRLAKLALAACAGRTAVGVEPAAGGGLQIWGLAHFGPTAALPSCLLVRGQGPGVVSVEIAGDTLFRYALGRGVLPHGRLDQGQRLSRLTEPLVDIAALRGIARHIVAHGRGGALLVLPDIDGARLEERFDELRYRVSGPAAELLAQRPALAEDALAFVGRLAAVDGAVLLASSLRVVAFGAFVKSPAPAPSIALMDASGRPQAASSLKGARHKSALWFCQSWPAALALVVSQDGEISLYVRKPEPLGVVVERDVEL
jgi:hypothetical protein